MEDFPDLEESDTGPTRGDRCIDRTFHNLGQPLVCGTLPPLETEDSRYSDHRIMYTVASLKRLAKFKWVTYSYRFYNKESADLFGKWAITNDWQSVLLAEGSNAKAEAYQGEVNDAMRPSSPSRPPKRRVGTSRG